MENQQNQEALDETVTRLVSRVKKNNETYAAYGCQLIFSGEARWDGIDLIEMRDRGMDINVNQGFYKARIQHTTPFEMFGDFDLACDDHLTHLLKNLQQLATDENCEMLDLFETRSSRCDYSEEGDGSEEYCDAYDFDGVDWFRHAEDLYWAHYSYGHEAKTCQILEGPFAGEVIHDEENEWQVLHKEYDPAQDSSPYGSGDFYDGIDLFEGSGIVFYPAEDEEGPEIHFSLNEADAALHFLLTGERPASAEVMPSA